MVKRVVNLLAGILRYQVDFQVLDPHHLDGLLEDFDLDDYWRSPGSAGLTSNGPLPLSSHCCYFNSAFSAGGHPYVMWSVCCGPAYNYASYTGGKFQFLTEKKVYFCHIAESLNVGEFFSNRNAQLESSWNVTKLSIPIQWEDTAILQTQLFFFFFFWLCYSHRIKLLSLVRKCWKITLVIHWILEGPVFCQHVRYTCVYACAVVKKKQLFSHKIFFCMTGSAFGNWYGLSLVSCFYTQKGAFERQKRLLFK